MLSFWKKPVTLFIYVVIVYIYVYINVNIYVTAFSFLCGRFANNFMAYSIYLSYKLSLEYIVVVMMV